MQSRDIPIVVSFSLPSLSFASFVKRYLVDGVGIPERQCFWKHGQFNRGNYLLGEVFDMEANYKYLVFIFSGYNLQLISLKRVSFPVVWKRYFNREEISLRKGRRASLCFESRSVVWEEVVSKLFTTGPYSDYHKTKNMMVNNLKCLYVTLSSVVC